jgi:hypothetical protein
MTPKYAESNPMILAEISEQPLEFQGTVVDTSNLAAMSGLSHQLPGQSKAYYQVK